MIFKKLFDYIRGPAAPDKSVTFPAFCESDYIDADFRALAHNKEYHKQYTALLGPGTYLDLTSAPHVLIAGATGSGKSVCINTILCSLLTKNCPYDQLQLFFIDPKKVDYIDYKPIATAYESELISAAALLQHIESIMYRRYEKLQTEHKKQWDGGRMLIVFDEIAAFSVRDLRRAGGLQSLNNIARLGRAAGIHIITATQRPTRDIIDGQLKANCPTRISFRLPTATDSRVILDTRGAELLTGKGDGIIIHSDGNRRRFQGLMLTEKQINHIIKHWQPPA